MAKHLSIYTWFATAANHSLQSFVICPPQKVCSQAWHSFIRPSAFSTLRSFSTCGIRSSLSSRTSSRGATLLNPRNQQRILDNSSTLFKTSSAQLFRGGHTCCPPSAAWDASAAVSSLVALSRAHLRQAHLRTYGKGLLQSRLAPYWSALSWESVQRLYKQTYAWLPSLPEFRHFHISVLSAVNITAAHLPRSLALLAIEYVRTTTSSKAHSFQYFLDDDALQLSGNVGKPRPWWYLLAQGVLSEVVNMLRTMWLLVIFAPVIITSPIALIWDVKRSEWMEMLRKTLESAGPAFIKWGQWAATRHDIFPPDFCSELEHLHCSAPAHTFWHTRKAIQGAFGVPIFELFESIDTTPVASGSIGQIHKAVLSAKGAAITGFKPGTTVAVKVRHPGVGHAVVRDFGTMMYVARLASKLPALRNLRLEDTLKQFAAPLTEQVDMSREAANLARFNHNFRKSRCVTFPVPLYPLVSADVLVESFEEGLNITSYINSVNNPYNHRLAVIGSGVMLQMMLMDNFIHSDLHPGNLLVRLEPPTGLLGLLYRGIDVLRERETLSPEVSAFMEKQQRRWLQPNMILLDVGMATELKGTDGEVMVGLFRSFAAMDGRACANWTLAFSGDKQACPNPEAFRDAMEFTFNQLRLSDVAGYDATCFSDSAAVLSSILENIRIFQVSLPGHICAVVVTTMVLEGWSNKLDPTHSVLAQVQEMFAGENVSWGQRIAGLVDLAMLEEETHGALR